MDEYFICYIRKPSFQFQNSKISKFYYPFYQHSKKAYKEPDLKLYMNPISKCKGVRHDDTQGVIFGGKKYFLCVNYAEICVNGNAVYLSPYDFAS